MNSDGLDTEQRGGLKINLPTYGSSPIASDAEVQINTVRLLSFGSTGSNIGERLDTNEKFPYRGRPIFTHVSAGKRDLYVLANEPDSLEEKLSKIRYVQDIKKMALSYGGSLYPPFLAFSSYEKIEVGSGSGQISRLSVSLPRVAAKVIANIQCLYSEFVAGGGDSTIKIRSLRIHHLPTSYSLWPDIPYTGSSFVSSSAETYPPNMAVDPTVEFKTKVSFYVPEYILETGKTSDDQSYMEMVVEMGSAPSTTCTYKIPIGNPAAASKPGSILRNTAYNYNMKIKKTTFLDDPLSVTCRVEPWRVEEVGGDAGHSWLNVSSTALEVDFVVDSAGLFFTSGEDVVVRVQEGSFFACKTVYTNSGKKEGSVLVWVPETVRPMPNREDPFAYKDTLLVITSQLTKKIPLSIFNRVSINNAGKNITNNWAHAMGYSSRYLTDTGYVNPLTTYMDIRQMRPDTNCGCNSYFEKSDTDPFTGKGKWRLPTYKEVRSIMRRIAMTGDFTYFGEVMFARGEDYWSLDQNSGSEAFSALNGPGEANNKGEGKIYSRCVRDRRILQ